MFNLKFNKGKASQIDLLKGNPATTYTHKTGNVWENPKVLEVNLIKENTAIEFDWGRNLARLALALLVTIFVIVEAYWGLNWWEQKETARANDLTAGIQQAKQEIDQVQSQANEFITFKNKLAALSPLLDNHIYWTNFFSWLERHTLNTVTFADFSGDTSGEYSLGAEARSYSDISYQVKALLATSTNETETETLKAEVLGGQSTQNQDKDGRVKSGVVSFSLDLKIKPDIFKK